MESLILFLEKHGKFTLEELAYIASHWNLRVHLKRNDFLIREGQTEKSLYFVTKGTQRIFYPHQDDEICAGFGYPNTILCSFPSLVRQEPSTYYIQTIKQSEFLMISQDQFKKLQREIPALQDLWLKLIEEALIGKIERELEMLTFTPRERYERLLRRSPHVFQLIPQKYLASYLGMEAETFSRIKKY